MVLYTDDDPEDFELISEAFLSYPQYIELMTFPDGVVLLNFIQSIDPLHSLFVYS